MKLNKIFFILFFPVMAQLVFSCCCCDDDPVTPITSVGQVSIDLIDIIAGYPQLLPRKIGEIDSIRKDSFGVAVEAFANQFAWCTPTTNQFDLLFSSAIACSCPEAYINYDKVKNFKIKTLTDFDSLTFAGDDITTYFKLFDNDTHNLLTINQDSIDVNRRLFLLLQQPPVQSKIYEFEVSFDVNDSLTLRDTTAQVFLF